MYVTSFQESTKTYRMNNVLFCFLYPPVNPYGYLKKKKKNMVEIITVSSSKLENSYYKAMKTCQIDLCMEHDNKAFDWLFTNGVAHT